MFRNRPIAQTVQLDERHLKSIVEHLSACKSLVDNQKLELNQNAENIVKHELSVAQNSNQPTPDVFSTKMDLIINVLQNIIEDKYSNSQDSWGAPQPCNDEAPGKFG